MRYGNLLLVMKVFYMKSKRSVIPDNMRDVFHYNTDTGNLIWKHRPLSSFANKQAFNAWNTKYSNTVAGTICNGYIRVCVRKKFYYAHNVIWFLLYGKQIPIGKEVDHRNNKSRDNRKSNLQLLSIYHNSVKKKKQKNNTSGLKGVSWCARAKKWKAQIQAYGEHMHLGVFKDKWEAYFHYCFWSHVFKGNHAKEF